MSLSIEGSPENLEGTLEALRGFALGFVVHALIETGVLDALECEQSAVELRSKLRCNDEAVAALLHYLQNERIVTRSAVNSFALTDRGRHLNRYRGWFRLFVGGYESVLRSLPDVLRHGVADDRNIAAVAQGSGEISRFDAAPLVARLIENSGRECRSILDLGCGNGQLLCQLLERFPDALGIAADPAVAAVAAARQTVSARSLENRVQLFEGDCFDVPEPRRTPTFILAAFTLQEILGQSGENTLVDRMVSTSIRWPSAQWLVVEVDHQPESDVMRTPYGLGYYNPYFLLHPLTGQTLLPCREWIRLFQRVGLTVESILTADPAIDPTGLEVGFLLQRSSRLTVLDGDSPSR
jgi:2-ketoarginine methyltransferase